MQGRFTVWMGCARRLLAAGCSLAVIAWALAPPVARGAPLDLPNGSNHTADITLSENLTITQATPAGSATISGAISESGGSFGLTKSGVGRISLSGANSFTGPIVVSQGTLQLDHALALGTAGNLFIGDATTVANANVTLSRLSGPGTFVLNQGVWLEPPSGTTTTFAGHLDGAATLFLDGPGTTVLSGTAAPGFSGSVQIVQGTLSLHSPDALGSGQLSLQGGAFSATFDTPISNRLFVGGDVTFLGGTNPPLHFSGNSVFNSAEITSRHDGAVVFSGNSIFHGDLTLKGGPGVTQRTFRFLGEGAESDPLNPGEVILENANVEMGHNDALAGRDIIVNSSSVLSARDGARTLDSDIRLNNTLMIVGSHALTLNGDISGTAALRKEGDGNLTLNGNNSFARALLDFGRVTLGSDTALGSGSVTVSGIALQSSGSRTLTNRFEVIGSLSVEGANNITLNGSVVGPGFLSKNGTGELVLNGANSYSGGTLLVAGPVRFSHDAAFGTGRIDSMGSSSLRAEGSRTLANDIGLVNPLQLHTAGTLNLTGRIAGRGSLSLTGPGTVRFSSSNDYSGGTTAEAGVMGIAADGALGIGTVLMKGAAVEVLATHSLGNNFMLNNNTIFRGGGDLTLNGRVVGPGDLILDGNTTLRLFGVNDFGRTLLESGTLMAGTSNYSLGRGAVVVQDGALQGNDTVVLNSIQIRNRLTVNGERDLALMGNISGGSLRKQGLSELTLAGNNTYSGGTVIEAGSIYVASNSAFGTGTVTINGISALGTSSQTTARVDNPLVLNANLFATGLGTLTLGGPISGSHGLFVSAARLRLSGANTYAGPTQVIGTGPSGANLIVDGSINSNVTVETGGVLSGVGQVNGNVNVRRGGAVAPGNDASLGVLTINGNYTNQPDSKLAVRLGPAGSSTRLEINGTATLNGGQVIGADNGIPLQPTTYTILTASQGVSGTFASASSSLRFYRLNLNHLPNSVTLTVSSNFAGGNPAWNDQQRRLAGHLDTLFANGITDPKLQTIFASMVRSTPSQMTEILNAVSGVLNTTTTTTTTQQTQSWFNTLAGQIRPLVDAGGGLTFRSLRPQLTEEPEIMLVSWNGGSLPLNYGNAQRRSPYFGWVTGFGTTGNVTNGPNAGGFDYSGGGTAFGIDRCLTENLLVGVAGGYSHTRTVPQAGDRVLDNGYQFSLYASHAFDCNYVLGSAGFTHHQFDSARQIVVGNIADTATAGYHGLELSGYLEAGRNLPIGKCNVQPFAAMQYIHLYRNSFIEAGNSPFNLAVDGVANNSLRGMVGGRIFRPFFLENGVTLIPQFQARFMHDFLLNAPVTTASFSGTPGTTFSVVGNTLGREMGVIGTGLSAVLNEHVSVYGNYDFAVAARATSHTGSGGVMVMW